MIVDITAVKNDISAVLQEYFTEVRPESGQLLVVGCSTSEVGGSHIGSNGSMETAAAILEQLLAETRRWEVFLAVQCCEHLNRALVVEREAMKAFGLEEVCVYPAPHAGGSLAACAMRDFVDPVVVESVKAHCGLDIGNTLIGMHLRPVAVPVRLKQKTVGRAWITAARTRPRLIGGIRAQYEKPER